jgi:hypothetical protein
MMGPVERTGVMTYRWCYHEINPLGDPHVALKPPYSGVTPQGTPPGWLAAHGWTNNFEAAAPADADADGAPAWEEFVADFSPVDGRLVMKLSLTKPPGPGPVLQWPATATRTYSVYRSTNLISGGFTLLTNGLPAKAPLNSYTDHGGGGDPPFYRIEVRIAP